MSKREQFRQQLAIFLDNDKHAIEVQQLGECLELAFLKLAPILSEADGENFATFMAGARASIARHLAEHVGESISETNRAKSN